MLSLTYTRVVVDVDKRRFIVLFFPFRFCKFNYKNRSVVARDRQRSATVQTNSEIILQSQTRGGVVPVAHEETARRRVKNYATMALNDNPRLSELFINSPGFDFNATLNAGELTSRSLPGYGYA